VDLTRGFNYSTGNEFRTAVSGLRAQGMNALILDLRDNPGGIVEQAVRTAETFLPAGTVIVSQRGRSDFDNRIWKSQNTAPENVPLVVLVDSGSASASEILAGALQDNDRALLVGEKTFGKGLVQSVMNLPFGNGLTLTTARYYTPTGRSIQRDYSNGDLYGYYRHEATEQSVRGFFAVKTASGRTVYGGDGITPDFTVRSPIQDQTQSLLRDPIFFFSVEVLAGRIPGLDVSEDLLSTVGHARTDTLLVDYENKIIGALREYLRKTDSFNGSNEEIDKNKHFIAMQIHYQLVAAKSGRVQANRIRMEDDLQIAKAVDAIPHANNLLKTKSPQASAKRQSRRAKL
jgi:carboxyl-terminal processing protease